MLNYPRGVRSRNRFSRSIIRDIDKALPSSSTAEKVENQKEETKDKSESSKDNETIKDTVVNKKTAKMLKLEEKNSNKNNDESKRSDKKDDATSRSKLSGKLDPDITEANDIKIKNELKETSKKEEDKKDNIELKQVDAEIVEDKKGQKKKNAKNLFGKSIRKAPKKEKISKVKPTETGLPGVRKMRAIKKQIKTFVKTITPFKKSKRGANNTQQDASNKKKPDEDVPKVKFLILFYYKYKFLCILIILRRLELNNFIL
jgi:Ras-related protein Rab-1A